VRHYYEDFYGREANIYVAKDGTSWLMIWARGYLIVNKQYKSFTAAKIALGRYSDGTARCVRTEVSA
jgi:hypothetical protein